MDSIFVRLKDTGRLVAHLLNLDRSVIKQFASARVLSTTMKRPRVVSSAEMRIFDPIALTMPCLINLFVLFVLLLYVPSQQLWSLRDGQFT